MKTENRHAQRLSKVSEWFIKTEKHYAQWLSKVSEWLFKNGRLTIAFCWTQKRNNRVYGVGNGCPK